MPESKHVLTSKIFISSIVGILANVLMVVLPRYNIDLIVSAEMQGFITSALFIVIGTWRTKETKPLHINSLQGVKK